MARISKSLVHDALDRAGKNITKAAGEDEIVSRKDMTRKLVTIKSRGERALTEQLYRFLDARDAGPGKRVTKNDVQRGVAYTKAHVIDNKDKNNNGFSIAETLTMSRLGQLAVGFATEMKTGKAAGAPRGISAAELEQKFVVASKDAMLVSETDSTPEFIITKKPYGASKAIDVEGVMKAFAPAIAGMLDEQDGDLSAWTADVYSPSDAAEFWSDVTTNPGEDAYSSGSFAKGWKAVKKVFDENLSDVTVVKVGPKGEHGSLESDSGTYVYMIIGRTQDGKLAGVQALAAET